MDIDANAVCSHSLEDDEEAQVAKQRVQEDDLWVWEIEDMSRKHTKKTFTSLNIMRDHVLELNSGRNIIYGASQLCANQPGWKQSHLSMKKQNTQVLAWCFLVMGGNNRNIVPAQEFALSFNYVFDLCQKQHSSTGTVQRQH